MVNVLEKRCVLRDGKLQLPSGFFKKVIDGVYEVEIEKMELHITKAGNEALRMTYKICNNQQYKDFELTNILSLKTSGVDTVTQELVRSTYGCETDEIDLNDFVGRKYIFRLERDEKYIQIKEISPLEAEEDATEEKSDTGQCSEDDVVYEEDLKKVGSTSATTSQITAAKFKPKK